jgi:hypothetical protein
VFLAAGAIARDVARSRANDVARVMEQLSR